MAITYTTAPDILLGEAQRVLQAAELEHYRLTVVTPPQPAGTPANANEAYTTELEKRIPDLQKEVKRLEKLVDKE